MPRPEIRKAAAWLVNIQNSDGGWGEDGTSYKLDYRGHEAAPSTASQTAWALLGLMAAGEVMHPAVARGIGYLSRTQGDDGFWDEPRYTAIGFPRVFYLRYHGYSKYFPLWALARYRNLRIAQRALAGIRNVTTRPPRSPAAFSAARIAASSCSTWRENTYSAGRCLSSGISGAIGPSVRTPNIATLSAASGCAKVASTAVGS